MMLVSALPDAQPETTAKPKRKGNPKFSTALSQAKQLQKVAFDKCQEKDCGPLAAASLMRAWCDLEERKRVLRGRPLPKPVDLKDWKAQQKKRKVVAPTSNFAEDSPPITTDQPALASA